MMIEIDIDNYLTDEDKKQICIDCFKSLMVANLHKERILSNMAYDAAFHIIDSALTPEMMESIRKKIPEIIADVSSFDIFRKKDAWGSEDSEAYLEVKRAVAEHKHLISGKVKDAILARDYTNDIDNITGSVGDIIINALKYGLQEKGE